MWNCQWERRQSRCDMCICIADAQSRGVRGHAPPPPEIFLKIDQNLCNLVRFLTHFSNFYKSTESTFYSWKLFTHENFFKRKHGRRKAEIRWMAEQLQAMYNKADPYYLLTRREEVTVFRLRTGNNHINYHLNSKLCISHTEQCPCGTGSQTTEHLLQSCSIYKPLRKGIWPDHTSIARKLYGSLGDLRHTTTFIEETGVSIWWTRRRRRLC